MHTLTIDHTQFGGKKNIQESGRVSDVISQSFTGTVSLTDPRVNYVVGNASKTNSICCYVQSPTYINHDSVTELDKENSFYQIRQT